MISGSGPAIGSYPVLLPSVRGVPRCIQFVSFYAKVIPSLYFGMLVVSCLVLSSLLMGSKLLKTTKALGSGPSSHLQSDMQLVVEETRNEVNDESY